MGHSHGGVSIWQGRKEKKDDGSSKNTEISRMEPDVLVRRSSSVTVARAVYRLSPNTSATTSFRAERRISSKQHYTILCSVMLMNNYILFL